MNIVTSHDGTKIAYDRRGQGPAVIFVDGALCARGSKADLATLLAPHFTVYTYDRRGRGDSGDTRPYAVDREIEDIAALIGEAGGTASLYGHSSGAALALRAAVTLGSAVPKIALYEAPYNDDPAAQRAWATYLRQLNEALEGGRRGDAVALFMALVGTPAEQIDGCRSGWPRGPERQPWSCTGTRASRSCPGRRGRSARPCRMRGCVCWRAKPTT